MLLIFLNSKITEIQTYPNTVCGGINRTKITKGSFHHKWDKSGQVGKVSMLGILGPITLSKNQQNDINIFE